MIRDRLFNNTIIVLKCLMGDLTLQRSGPIIFKDRFDSFHVSITEIHLHFFITLNNSIATNIWLDHELLTRWKIVNQLIINHISYSFNEITTGFPNTQNRNGQKILQEKSLIIASFVAYPLLEEIARRISNAWNEDGNLTINIWKKDNPNKPLGAIETSRREYKLGSPIYNLSDKLQIMKQFLNSEIIPLINDLDNRLRRSPFQGDSSDVFNPLFDNLTKNRNKFLHGRDFDGYDAIYISLIISLLYSKLRQQEIGKLRKCHEQNPTQYSDAIMHFPAPFSYQILPKYLS
jgi:hypothetical protein